MEHRGILGAVELLCKIPVIIHLSQSIAMYHTKSELSCKSWALGDNDVPCGFISCNTCNPLEGEVDGEGRLCMRGGRADYEKCL